MYAAVRLAFIALVHEENTVPILDSFSRGNLVGER
jgi:hypothetical protein